MDSGIKEACVQDRDSSEGIPGICDRNQGCSFMTFWSKEQGAAVFICRQCLTIVGQCRRIPSAVFEGNPWYQLKRS